ncbi:MAG: RnfABCDGE type electron transport complex subunit G [Bacteroidales bacterium]|nr:RnfABCDGE type electron transport complex subunit G [Bacteroidales bacterium]
MASKKESSFINMVLTLFVVTAIAALALGAVYVVTKKPIELANKQKQEDAIKKVLPDFDTLKVMNLPDASGKDTLQFNVASKDGQLVGVAIKTYTDKGFGGRIDVMVGFYPNGSICNTAVLQMKETPGLGTNLEHKNSDFPNQFEGKNPATYKLKVKKDGGDVDAITAATISSRAFCDALQRAYDAFEKQKGKF